MRKVSLDSACAGSPQKEVIARANRFAGLVTDPAKEARGITRDLRAHLAGARETAANSVDRDSGEGAIMESSFQPFGTPARILPLKKTAYILFRSLKCQASSIRLKRARERAGLELKWESPL